MAQSAQTLPAGVQQAGDGLIIAIFGVLCSATAAVLLAGAFLAVTGQWRHIFPFSTLAG